MSCTPLPTSASNIVTTGGQDNGPVPSPTHSTNDNTSGGISIGTSRTMITQVQSAITTTIPNWPQTKAVNTSLPETTIIIFSVTPSMIIFALAVILTLLLILTYRCIKRKKSKLLKQDDSNIQIKHTKVIQVGMDETASHPTSNEHAVNLGQGTLNRRQHVCTRVASDSIVYNGQYDAASPEPEVVVMIDSNLEESCDEERYTSIPFEHSHVTLSCDGHVTDPANHLYDTIDQQPVYESVLAHSTIPQSQHSPQMKRNQNPAINSARSHSQTQNSVSPFQRSLTIGGVYSTRTTSSLHSTSSHTTYSHRSSLTSSGASAGVSQRMSGGRGSRMSHHRLSTAGGSVVSSSRAGTSTQGSMGSGILPMQE